MALKALIPGEDMEGSIKTAAEHLLKIADEIEKEAEAYTLFACDSCTHTASLKTINDTVKTASEDLGKDLDLITVNDRVACVSCGSVMSYMPTAKSAAYYVEAEEKDSAMIKESPAEPVTNVEEVEEVEEAEKEASKVASAARIDKDKLAAYLNFR
jgi:hypothetical protein